MRVLLLIIIVTGSLWSQLGLSRRMGDRLYDAGDHKRAFDVYNRLLRDNPNDPELNYNAGNCLYKLERYEDARKYYERALANTSDTKLRNDIHYNLANCDFREKKVRESVEKYKQVLRADAMDDDARHNLELALQQLRQPPPPPSKGDQNKSSKQQEEEKKESGGQGQNQQPSDPSQKQNQTQGKQPQLKFSKEEAERLLDALHNQEKQYQERKLKEKVTRDQSSEKDW